MLIIFTTMLLSVMNAFAGPGRATYQAKIVKPDGYPLEASNVNFKFTILDPVGSCILFSETYSAVNMTSTGGLVSFSLGSGVKTYPVSSPTFEDVFSNITPTLSCDAGGPVSYSPSASDIRKIVMQFHDGNGWQTLPAMNINAVPYAMYANNAEKLGGVSATAFVQDSEIPTCPGGQALTYNGTMFSCIVSGGGSVSAAAVVSALGYTPADSASFTAVTSDLSNVSTYATNVSATVFSVSSTVSSLATSVTSLQSAVAVSFAAITSSQWVTSGTTVSYNLGNVLVSGGVRISMDASACSANSAGTLRYNAGVVEYCNGTSWSAFGVAGAGITLMNGSASGSQTFGTGINGTVFNITSVNGVHTFNIPLATSAAVTAGLVSNADLTYLLNSAASTAASFTTIASDQAVNAASFAAVATTLAVNAVSFATLSSSQNTNAASFSSIANSLSTIGASFSVVANSQVTNAASFAALAATQNTNAVSFASIASSLSTIGTSFVVVANNQITNAASFAAVANTQAVNAASFAAIVSSQWTTAASNVYFNSGNVGIGLTNPSTGKLTITKITAATSYALAITGSDPGVGSINRAVLLNMSAGNVNQGNTGIYIHNANGMDGSGTGVDVSLNNRDNAFGFKVNATKYWGGALFGTAAGIHATVGTDSTLGESYGGYFTNTSSAAAKAYGIYVNSNSGGTDAAPLVVAANTTEVFRVSVSGNVGVGTNQPTALFNLAAGTSAKASLKFTSGTLLTSPQSGSVEYDGFNYYITDSTNTRRTIATVGSNSSFATGSFTGSIDASGSITTTSNLTAPTIYGSSLPSENLTIDSTSSATKGNVIIAPSGGYVGVGTSSPIGTFHVALNNPGTALSAVSDAFILQNKNTTSNALTSILFTNQNGFGTGQIASLQNTGNFGSQMILATKSGGGGSWNTSQLVLNTNGRVGVGTNLPASALDVKTPNDTTPAFYVGDSSTNGVTGLYFSRWGSASAPMGIQGTVAGVGANTITLQAQSGNVGIGTTSATSKLTVYDGDIDIPYVANKTHGYSLGLGNNVGYIWRNYAYADDSYFMSQNWYANDAGVDVIPNAAHTTQALEMRRSVGIMFKTGAVNTVPSTRMMVTPTGNVGIGTTNPLVRLHIATPASGGINNRLVTGNSNSDLMDISGQTGDIYLDHVVSARLNATTSATVPRAATFKIDQAPTVASSSVTITNAYAFWVESGNSLFGGNVGVGVSGTPSSYSHGGSNKFIEIQNSNTTVNAQAHLLLTTGVSAITGSSIGTLTWAQPNSTGVRKDVAWISSVTESASSVTPAANIGFNTRSVSDTSPVERMRISSSGNVGIGNNTPFAPLTIGDSATKRGYLLLKDDGVDPAVLQINDSRTGGRTFNIYNGYPTSGSFTITDLNAGNATRLAITAGGYLGIGTHVPATSLSNVPNTATHSNVGDANGTGENANSLTWATAAGGFTAAIVNASAVAGANGLQVRTLGTAANNTIFTAGTGVSSSANANDIFTVKANGSVGIGITAPTRPLAVNGTFALYPNTADHIYMEFYARTAAPTTRSAWFGYGGAAATNLQMTNEITNGNLNFVTTGTGKIGVNQLNPSYMLDVGGTLRGFGITDSSDIRLKKQIEPLDLSLEKILRVDGVTYYWKNKKITEKKQIGFIAQQLEKVFPELVETDNQGMKSVNYSHLVAPLVEAVKSLYVRITNIEAHQSVQSREIATIKDENQELKRKNQELEKRLENLEKFLNNKK